MKWFQKPIVYISLVFIAIGVFWIFSHTSQYARYTDQYSGVSFEYLPSSSQISTGAVMDDELIYIDPPGAHPSDKKGVVITVEPCKQKCPANIADYIIKLWSSPDGNVTIISTNTPVGSHAWVKAKISDPPSPVQDTYVTVIGKNIIWVGNWAGDNPAMTPIFNRVLETLNP